jgi:hypothetical protein
MNALRFLCFGVVLLLACPAGLATTNTAAAIAASFRADQELQGIPFGEVVAATTGRRVLPVDLKQAADRDLMQRLGRALDEVLRRLNATNSAAQQQRRINEVSAPFENELKAVLNAQSDFTCDFPRTANGRVQRAGYPDLRLEDRKTGRVLYVDPKLYERGSRASSFRTFYYEPKVETAKILADAHHLIVGIEHDGRADGVWRFLGWELVDVAHLRVRLKAEFQSSNRELYRPELIVGSSRTNLAGPAKSAP